MTSGTAKPFRVIQITDTHLSLPENGTLLGMDTTQSLKLVLDLVREEQHHIDLILVTGDLSQDGSLVSYERLAQMLSEFSVPYYCLPGNHDDNQVLSQAFSRQCLQKQVILDNWQIVLLDSSVPLKVHGFLEDSELDFLQSCLDSKAELNTLISLHHHPIDMGCRWIDNIGVRNADQFMSLIREHQDVHQNQIRCILWGHVHQEVDVERFGLRMLATPSTCVQFTPKSPEFKVDTLGPGYRWIELYENGQVKSGVSRVNGVDFQIDYSVKGY